MSRLVLQTPKQNVFRNISCDYDQLPCSLSLRIPILVFSISIQEWDPTLFKLPSFCQQNDVNPIF
eukprot:c40694_g1_i1 orf=42-236(-)